eukprot:TRINITY_DN743_c0_g3_i1.p2 TRINITY_DN743_c0_g3~~TRINITY_DN743_c0_g3_i1.p2  ORF type:complete len:555 (-),score=223.45 TRINITY_DN743_c0_g3_i1:1426-3090(-)
MQLVGQQRDVFGGQAGQHGGFDLVEDEVIDLLQQIIRQRACRGRGRRRIEDHRLAQRMGQFDGVDDGRHRHFQLQQDDGSALDQRPGTLDVLDIQPPIGTGGDDDTVLCLRIDHDGGDAGGFPGDLVDVAVIDAGSHDGGAHLGAKGIIAHARHHGDPCARRGQARAGHRLVGTLAAGDGHETLAGQGFPRHGHARHAQYQVHVDAADDDDHVDTLVSSGSSGWRHVRGRGAAHMELRRHRFAACRQGRVGDAFQQELRGQVAQPARVLGHRGQRRMDELGQFDIVEADHRQLAGHLDLQFTRGPQHANGHHVVAAEDGVRSALALQQLHGGLVTADAAEVGMQQVAVGQLHAAHGERAAQAIDPLVGQLQPSRTGDAGNALAAQRQQMVGGQLAAQEIVGTDQVDIALLGSTVQQHGGNIEPTGRLQVALVQGGDDEAIAALGLQYLQIVALLVGVVIGIAQDHAIAGAIAVILDTACQLREIRVGIVGDDQADTAGHLAAQGARQRTGDVVQVLDGLQHPLARLGADRAGLVEHVGHRGVRHPGQSGDILDG